MATSYVVGHWVRGDSFYGREDVLTEILQGPRDNLWLLGTRRIGKTSVLREAERRTNEACERRDLAVYWDLEGADSEEGLQQSFRIALIESEFEASRLGVGIQQLRGPGFWECLARLVDAVKRGGRRLLLLCDEAEALVTVHERAPSALPRLRRALQSGRHVRTVLVSSVQLRLLWEKQWNTSPFLDSFGPPMFLRELTDPEAIALVRQDKQAASEQPDMDDAVAEAITVHAGNHPLLVQLLAKVWMESRDLIDAVERLAMDPMVRHYCQQTYDSLNSVEQDALKRCIASESPGVDTEMESLGECAESPLALAFLRELGLVKVREGRKPEVCNYFFRRWLASVSESETGRARPRDAVYALLRQTDQDGLVPSEGRRIAGRYALQSVAGSGVTGRVFKALDERLGIPVAIKFLGRVSALGVEDRRKIRREVLLARKVVHPNVVQVYDIDEWCGFITMQWIEGSTLARVIDTCGGMPPQELYEMSLSLVSALEAVHAQKILHKDIKPSNILVDDDHKPYLADFGLAMARDQILTQATAFSGTLAYASPEQLQGVQGGEPSDIYSLGVVIFEMATGRRPFEGSTIEEMRAEHARTGALAERVSREIAPRLLSNLVARCLEVNPSQRPQSAAELRLGLEQCRDSSGT